ncbi:hypothetical protein JW865_06620, partial [Candidatus Bathyarchaeota archaeon]|nr:hypothetical protein [Candidatus Bathyarchaeota archaeon]
MEAPHFPEKYQLLAQVLGKIHRNGLTDFHINPKQLETQLLEQYLQDHDEQPPFNYQGPTNKTPNTNNKPDKKMGNREKILEHLQENPEGICDDCLSIHLDIKP